ncbi:putative oxidoreductase OrdL [Penicillium rolfsii]|nr:putative oxidoreductase OrdL [Penicillium rolfsii]
MTSSDNGSSRNLPNATPCLSYWQRTTRAFPHLFANRNDSLPTKAKYVVIGSGISGGLTVFELLEAGVQGEDIVILEAREAASGASSRNAGHVRPDAFRGFNAYAKVHGPDQALKIIANERLVLQKVDEYVKQHQIPCDFNLTTTFDVCMTPEFAAYEAESLEAYKQAGGDVSHITFYEGPEAQAKTRIPGAVAAYEWPAGSSHPAKLAQFLLQSVINRGAKLFTFCPATQVKQGDSNSWDVHTPRGIITAEKIIHCTNAHAALLVPQLEAYIRPNRAQAHSLMPTPAFAAENALQNTFSLRYSLHHFYSLIQRGGDGTLILGVSRSNPTLSPETLAGRFSTDDSHFNEEIAQDALRSFNNLFPDYAPDGKDISHGEGLDHAWTGIIAMTTDSVPFVGAIDSLPGQYICAGFNGHGMARIFTCAPGIAKIVLGHEWSDTGLPECFQFNSERLAWLSNGDLSSIW